MLLKHLYNETDQIEAAILPSVSLTTQPWAASIHRTILEASKRKNTLAFSPSRARLEPDQVINIGRLIGLRGPHDYLN